MRIIYGVSGQGLGHAMRSKVVLDYLKANGHEITVVCFNQSFDYLKKYFNCFPIISWELVYKNNKLKYWATAFKDARKIPKVVGSLRKVKKLFDEFQPNVVFTDYEPMTSVIAKIKKIPCISIGNHHFITRTKISFPRQYYRYYLPVKVVNNAWTPYANHFFVSTFVEEKIKNKNTTLVPPILAPEVLKLQPKAGSHILVYLSAGISNTVEILKKVNKKFIIYGCNEERQDENLIFRKFSREGFLNDLQNCQAVIANAGFSLISEALYLRKPYLAWPFAKQFEQIINAIYLQKLGYGLFTENLTLEDLNKFFDQLKIFKSNLAYYKRQNNSFLFAKIAEILNGIEIKR